MLDFGGGAGGNVECCEGDGLHQPIPALAELTRPEPIDIYCIYQVRLLHSRELPPVTNSQAFLRSTIRKTMQSGGRNIHPPAAAVKLRSRSVQQRESLTLIRLESRCSGASPQSHEIT